MAGRNCQCQSRDFKDNNGEKMSTYGMHFINGDGPTSQPRHHFIWLTDIERSGQYFLALSYRGTAGDECPSYVAPGKLVRRIKAYSGSAIVHFLAIHITCFLP